jgi:hypothetical protein
MGEVNTSKTLDLPVGHMGEVNNSGTVDLLVRHMRDLNLLILIDIPLMTSILVIIMVTTLTK